MEAGLARERTLYDGERTELRSGSDPPYGIKRRGKHGKSNYKACHQRRAETEKQETTKDTNKTALDALFVPPSLYRLAYEVVREKEFAPIKNKTGVDSVESARELLKKNGIEL